MIFNVGSINADYFYDLPDLPGPGETLAATCMASGLGGKGANQSVAAAFAGVDVRHIGCVGSDGAWAVDRPRALVAVSGPAGVRNPRTPHPSVLVLRGVGNQTGIFPAPNHTQDDPLIPKPLEGPG